MNFNSLKKILLRAPVWSEKKKQELQVNITLAPGSVDE